MTQREQATCERLKVRAETAQLAGVRDFVARVATEAALGPERVFDLKVATSEAFANAVEHACSPAEDLEVCVSVSSERLVVEISDEGCFRPPTLPRETGQSRGLGLPLMVSLMDEVSFARTPGGGTTVRLAIFFN
jgi:serine/threonine-protein kinase RsbW